MITLNDLVDMLICETMEEYVQNQYSTKSLIVVADVEPDEIRVIEQKEKSNA
jgi:hypothetical protein